MSMRIFGEVNTGPPLLHWSTLRRRAIHWQVDKHPARNNSFWGYVLVTGKDGVKREMLDVGGSWSKAKCARRTRGRAEEIAAVGIICDAIVKMFCCGA